MDARTKPRVLVVEDEVLVSMLIEEELTKAGFDVAGPFATCAEASHWLNHATPDAAVLDHELRDGPCTEVALELCRRGIPFVVMSGSNPADLPAIMRDAAAFSKPDSMERLAKTVARLLRTPA